MALEMVCGVMVISRSNGANTMESSRLNIYSYTADTWMHSISWWGLVIACIYDTSYMIEIHYPSHDDQFIIIIIILSISMSQHHHHYHHHLLLLLLYLKSLSGSHRPIPSSGWEFYPRRDYFRSSSARPARFQQAVLGSGNNSIFCCGRERD